VSVPLRVLLVTDAFPPICGGSGWSTYELAKGLAARGHHVDVVKTEVGLGHGVHEGRYETFRVTTMRGRVPDLPVVRNVVKNEKMWAGLANDLLAGRLKQEPVDVLHGQHVMSTVPAIRAAMASGVPVVATVRDYWPVCYWSDLIYDPESPHLCPECSVRMMSKCVLPRAGAASIGAWPLIPYMRRNLRTKRRTLARASAIIAVSTTIARDLRARAPEIAQTPMYTIPNPVDMAALDDIHDHAGRPMAEPYLLYAGKLATNKGIQFLMPALEAARIRWPLVVVGDGPMRGRLAAEGRAAGIDVRELGWLPRREVWTWMRHAALLAFPSYGPESLSRVLIEAAALGVPIAAMETGGTRDILHAGTTGLLSSDPRAFAQDLARLAADERLRASLAAAARSDVRVRFASTAVVEQVEQVYRSLLQPEAA
jgi:glycosyltransferase involved in cell wall biosynthesis